MERRGKGQPLMVTAQMHEHVLQILPCTSLDLYNSSQILVDGLIKLARYYGFPVPALGYDVYNIEAEALGQKLHYIASGTPQAHQGEYLLKEKKDLKSLIAPLPGESGRMPFVLASLREYKKKTGIIPPLQFTAPFTLATRLYGYQRLAMDLILDPAFVHSLLSFLTKRVLIPWLEVQMEVIPDFVVALGADASASPPALSIQQLKEFVLPYILHLKEVCGEKVGVVNWWGDSVVKDYKEFLDLKKNVSPENKYLRIQDPDLEVLDPSLFVDYAVKNKLSLALGLSTRLLSRGPIKAIEERVTEFVQKGKKVEGFELYLCNLGKDTQKEHIKAALRAAEEAWNSSSN